MDASVLIAHLDASDAHHTRAGSLLLAAAGESLGASPVTLAEVLVGPARAGRLSEAAKALSDLDVSSLDLPADAPFQLAALRAGTGLKLPDCCVLMAAEQAHAEVATFDARLARVSIDRGLTLRP